MADKIAYSGHVNISGNLKIGKKKCDLAYVIAKENEDNLTIMADVGGIVQLSLFKGNKSNTAENEKYNCLVKDLLNYKAVIKIESESIVLEKEECIF
jgi:hypothetical protein